MSATPKLFLYLIKKGVISSEQTAEFWYLDRSFQWHYLTNSFKSYYRLLIAHLGLPQWQMLFTEDGLPPYLYVNFKDFSENQFYLYRRQIQGAEF